jgi:hypothetical protein
MREVLLDMKAEVFKLKRESDKLLVMRRFQRFNR